MIVRVFLGLAKKFILSLFGLVLFWLLYSFKATLFMEGGKGWFNFYFSLFLFVLLFFPIYLIGKNFFSRCSFRKPFPRALQVYIFISGLLQFPVVLVVDHALESFWMAEKIWIANGWRLLPLVSISACATALIAVAICVIFAKLGNAYR